MLLKFEEYHHKTYHDPESRARLLTCYVNPKYVALVEEIEEGMHKYTKVTLSCGTVINLHDEDRMVSRVLRDYCEEHDL